MRYAGFCEGQSVSLRLNPIFGTLYFSSASIQTSGQSDGTSSKPKSATHVAVLGCQGYIAPGGEHIR